MDLKVEEKRGGGLSPSEQYFAFIDASRRLVITSASEKLSLHRDSQLRLFQSGNHLKSSFVGACGVLRHSLRESFYW